MKENNREKSIKSIRQTLAALEKKVAESFDENQLNLMDFHKLFPLFRQQRLTRYDVYSTHPHHMMDDLE